MSKQGAKRSVKVWVAIINERPCAIYQAEPDCLLRAVAKDRGYYYAEAVITYSPPEGEHKGQ